MNRITLTLERIAAGAALALMLTLAALTLAAPVPATASPPVLIVATPLIAGGAGPIRAPADQGPPAAQVPTPALPTPVPTAAPEPTAAIVIAQSPPSAPVVAEPSQLVIEPDGHARLPGSEDWMAALPPPPPEPTAAPQATEPLPPRGGCGPRCGWRPKP